MLSCSPWAFPELANWKIHRISFYLLRKVEKSCLKNDKKSNPLVVLVVPAIMILLKVALVWLSTFFNSVSKSITFLNKYRHAQRKSLYYLDRGSLQIMSACRAPKNVWAWLFLVGNQGNHQNFDPSLLTNKLWLVFMGMKQTKSTRWFSAGRFNHNGVKFKWPLINSNALIGRIFISKKNLYKICSLQSVCCNFNQ